MKAIWNRQVIAQSADTVVVEGNHYFPADTVNRSFLQDSSTTTECNWKGTANYYSIKVKDKLNVDAAWYYAEPKAEARHIKGHVAFWRGVEIVDS